MGEKFCQLYIRQRLNIWSIQRTVKNQRILKQVSLSNKWANKLSRYCSKERCRQIIKLKKYSTTLVVCQLERETVVGFYITPVRKTDFTKDSKYDHGCLLMCININWSCHEKAAQRFLRTLKSSLPHDLAIPGYTPKALNPLPEVLEHIFWLLHSN